MKILKIDFPSARDKAFFENPKDVTKAFGADTARKLRLRMDDLDAAQSMEDMRGLPGHWEELRKDRAGQFSVRLGGGYRLIVKPQRQPPPTKPDGGMDWKAIDSIYVIEVVDYHD